MMTQSLATARASLRVLILEDHVLFAEALELALSVEGYDVRRVPVPEDERAPAAVLAAALRLRPRVVLLDLDLGGFGDGARLISPLARAGCNVIVVTASTDRSRWGEAIRFGARKVLSKSRPLNEILAAVRRINQGLAVMTREEREELLSAWYVERSSTARPRRASSGSPRGSARCSATSCRGGRCVRSPTSSVVSEATVRTQVKSILAKLEVSSQLAAVGLAHSIGWRGPKL